MGDGAAILRAAVIQMTTGPDRDTNIEQAGRLVAEAASGGARLVVLPEKWNVIDTDERQPGHAEPLTGPSLTVAAGWARTLGIVLLAGSISEASPGDGRAFNTSVLLGPDGARLGVYRKLHLFDVDVAGHAYRESAGTRPGDAITVADVDGRRLGMTVCYDLRFPELFRALAGRGAEIVTVPAAFTAVTGAAHWEVLLRARAIENQVFVLAAGQVGEHATGTASYGHSMIVDPWGTVLAGVEEGAGVALADLDFAAMAGLRRRMPVLAHRRLEVGAQPKRVGD